MSSASAPAGEDTKSWSNIQVFPTRGVRPDVLIQQLNDLMNGKMGDKYELERKDATTWILRSQKELEADQLKHFVDPNWWTKQAREKAKKTTDSASTTTAIKSEPVGQPGTTSTSTATRPREQQEQSHHKPRPAQNTGTPTSPPDTSPAGQIGRTDTGATQSPKPTVAEKVRAMISRPKSKGPSTSVLPQYEPKNTGSNA